MYVIKHASLKGWVAVASLIIVVAASVWVNGNWQTPDDNQSLFQADALLYGRLDIPIYSPDVAVVNGRFYVPFPPLPAFLLLPLVALVGADSLRVVAVSLVLALADGLVLARLLGRVGLRGATIPWLVIAFLLGTGFWLVVVESEGVWQFALVVGTTCLLLALHEAFGRGRGLAVGLLLSLAFLCRQLALFNLFFLGMALWHNRHFPTRRARLRNLAGASLGLAVGGLAYLSFNWLRFGDPFETGYGLIYANYPIEFLRERVRLYGLFHPAYVPFNFVHLFLQGFHIRFAGPTFTGGMEMDPFGTSLTFASPFLFLAFLAKWKRPLLVGAWLSVGCIVAGLLLYHANGWVQLNAQRYTLDFLPTLLLLVGLGTRRAPARLWQAAIAYAIGLNTLALVIIPILGRIG